MSDPLQQLARRVEGDPFFLGWALAHYAHSERLDDAGLAAALGCAVSTLTDLRLCRLPAAEPAGFRQDVDRIAARFHVDAAVLAEAVKRARALEAMRQGAATAAGTLLAARDKRQPDEERPGSEGGPP